MRFNKFGKTSQRRMLADTSSENPEDHLPELHPIIRDILDVTLIILSGYADIGISEAGRSLTTQKGYLAREVTKTLDSLHRKQDETEYGHAVDLFAYIPELKGAQWKAKYLVIVADAVVKATAIIEKFHGVEIKVQWGAAWHTRDLVRSELSPKEAMQKYIDNKRAKGGKPFIDAPHFGFRFDGVDN